MEEFVRKEDAKKVNEDVLDQKETISERQTGLVLHRKFYSFQKIGKCQPKDNDACLQSSPGWGASYTCEDSTSWCVDWGKDMRRCCPESCDTGDLVTIKFTEEDCTKFPGEGTCTYPNNAQCTDGKLLNLI